MPRPAIDVQDLSKQYELGAAEYRYGSLREALVEGFKKPFRQLRGETAAARPRIWALKDVNFTVERGQAVGIIGRNGAGKSTLLKILSRITEPTRGRVVIHGRVASLLEVGTGFHAELSGRENIYLNGAILGMSRHEIRRKFDEIVQFAEVEAFVDTPVKRYSSGMYLRLAFAVAAHLEPEILVVDEVLAVGDADFQRKCLGKMGEVTGEGRTVLFVSHNLAAVRALCRSAVYLNRGEVTAVGPAGEVIDLYSRSGMGLAALSWTRDEPTNETDPEASMRILALRVLDAEGAGIRADRPLRVALEFAVEGTPSPVIPGVHFHDPDGTILFSSAQWNLDCLAPGSYTSICDVPAFMFNDGRVSVSAYLYGSARPGLNELPVDWVRNVISFDVDSSPWIEKTGSRWLRNWPGLIRPDLSWTCAGRGPEPLPAGTAPELA